MTSLEGLKSLPKTNNTGRVNYEAGLLIKMQRRSALIWQCRVAAVRSLRQCRRGVTEIVQIFIKILDIILAENFLPLPMLRCHRPANNAL